MKAKKQWAFALSWTGVYTFVFNLIKPTFAAMTAVDIIWAAAWVFLLFLVATYSRIFFFTVIPFVFVTSGMVAYAEWLMHAPIPRDVVISAFQSNWQELYGVTGKDFLVWICGSLFLSVLCARHLLHLKLNHHSKIKLIITTGFLSVFWLCTSLVFNSNLENIFHWQHPYDYFEYTTNFVKEAIAQSKLKNKYDLSSIPIRRAKEPDDLPLQVVVIIGEAARADHFGVYGYARNTTPLLHKESNLIFFNDVSSCGTTTMISVPCLMTRATKTNLKPSTQETSFVSLFKKLGFNTIWVSEQAKFNGIDTVVASISNEADKTVFQDNTLTLKLNEFKDYFHKELLASKKETLSIFHMLGSHLPYQWMYPEEFKRFTPICPDLHPQSCPQDLLINNYDNTIVFTDYFLATTIDSLKDKNAIMVYVADHGEYLGERGKYLHGQETEDAEVRHVPMIWWVSDQFIKLYPDKVRAMRVKVRDKLSHDHVFHSVLDCAGIESSVVDKSLSVCH
jgi:glucan phosphoethanolaminetransferase (alkaline phosphatase superfamily)